MKIDRTLIAALGISAIVTSTSVASETRLDTLSCLVQPSETASLGFSIPGHVDRIPIERNQPVSAGDILATLDDRRAVLDLENARNQEVLAKDRFIRASALRESNAISQDELSALEQSLQSARHEVQIKTLELEMHRLTAPFDGVITNISLERGQAAADQTRVEMVSLDPLSVVAILPSSEYMAGADLTRPTVIDLVSSTARRANLVSIDRFIDSDSDTFRVTFSVRNSDSALLAGAGCKILLD